MSHVTYMSHVCTIMSQYLHICHINEISITYIYIYIYIFIYIYIYNLRLKLFAIELSNENPKKQIHNQSKEQKSMIISHSLSLRLNISQL